MIYFFGDTHGHFDHVLEIVSRDRPAAIVFLGDLQAQRPLEVELESILGMTEVWFIHGNHDTDSDADYDHLFDSALADRNLHGRVAVVDGVRIAGLGGVFRGAGVDAAGGLAVRELQGVNRALWQGQSLARRLAAQAPQFYLSGGLLSPGLATCRYSGDARGAQRAPAWL